MAVTTLPSFTKTMDDLFTDTWYNVKAEAIDNILDATVITAKFREMGVFTTQVGEKDITETIKYGNQRGTAVQKGDLLGSGEPLLETTARWDWRYLAGHIQRSIFDDQQNQGEMKIKDYVEKRITDMRDGLEQDIEERFFGAEVTAESGKLIQGLNDIIPATLANRILGTFGGINRPLTYDVAGGTAGLSKPATGNIWWGPKYFRGNTPKTVHLLNDMTTFFNSISANREVPNLLVTDQGLFELYEAFSQQSTQLIKNDGDNMADLGYTVLKFKGQDLIWSDDATTDHIMFLNTNFIKVVYDPTMWFEMTEFKPIALQGERIAHILVAMNVISNQPRRHGRLHYTSS